MKRAATTASATADAIRAAAVDEAMSDVRASRLSRVGDQDPYVAVVMAAYNESGSVGPVLQTLPESVCGLGLISIVVDDGSTDQTAAEARAGGALVGTHHRNLGQGDALRTGFAIATRLGVRVVVTMDADGQHNPAELASLVGPVVAGEADYVQGSRFLGEYDDAGGARDFGIRCFTWLINTLARTTITDCTNGFRAIDGPSLARLRLVEDRFSAAEIIIEAAGQGLRMREVPVHIRSRELGTSKKPRGLGYAWGYPCAIVRSWLRARRSRSVARRRHERNRRPGACLRASGIGGRRAARRHVARRPPETPIDVLIARGVACGLTTWLLGSGLVTSTVGLTTTSAWVWCAIVGAVSLVILLMPRHRPLLRAGASSVGRRLAVTIGLTALVYVPIGYVVVRTSWSPLGSTPWYYYGLARQVAESGSIPRRRPNSACPRRSSTTTTCSPRAPRCCSSNSPTVPSQSSSSSRFSRSRSSESAWSHT